jgi:hypothetical protein
MNFGALKLQIAKASGIGGKGRHIRPRPDDRFLVGYPKSGNTWLNFLVACSVVSDVEEVNFESINTIVADVHALSPLQLFRLKSPRILKSHDYYCEGFPKVVHIRRHPFSVAVSYYYFLMKRRRYDESYSLSEFVEDWIAGKWGGQYGTWESHNRSWLEQSNQKAVHLLKYEDLKTDTLAELQRVAEHFEIEVTPKELENAVSWSSAENMSRLERLGFAKGFQSMKDGREDIAFVRTEGGPARQSLSDQDEARIRNAWGGLMSELGYQ